MGSYIGYIHGYEHEKGMEAACGSSFFTKAFFYVLSMLICLSKIISPDRIAGCLSMILLKLPFICLSVVWWYALAGAIYCLDLAF